VALTTIEPVTVEPVTLSEAKAQLRVDSEHEDPTIYRYITAARTYLEGQTRRALAPAKYRYTMSYFLPVIDLPMPPVTDVTLFQYVDENGSLQTLTDYDVYGLGAKARLAPKYGEQWPLALRRPESVIIEFEAGYRHLPEDLKHALLLLVSHFYEIRQPAIVGTSVGNVPMTVEALISPYRVVGF